MLTYDGFSSLKYAGDECPPCHGLQQSCGTAAPSLLQQRSHAFQMLRMTGMRTPEVGAQTKRMGEMP